jgi:hypothetical protein
MGQRMISLRLAFSAVLATAVLAGCFTYLITPPWQVEAVHRSSPTVLSVQVTPESKGIDPLTDDEDKAVAAFLQAADEILRRAPNTRASAATYEQPISGKVPLPKKRPIARP